MNSRKIEKKDVLDLNDFAAIRNTKRTEITEIKKHRRVPVGPDATFYFESYDTMWWQIHEMLFIEKGGDEQVNDELEAYNPLIPQGDELVATLMFEIDDPARRKNLLMKLGGVEEMCFLEVGQDKIKADAEAEAAQKKAEAKKKFKVYPSAYANGWLVREYKKRGGTYNKVRLKSGGRD